MLLVPILWFLSLSVSAELAAPVEQALPYLTVEERVSLAARTRFIVLEDCAYNGYYDPISRTIHVCSSASMRLVDLAALLIHELQHAEDRCESYSALELEDRAYLRQAHFYLTHQEPEMAGSSYRHLGRHGEHSQRSRTWWTDRCEEAS